MALPDTRDLTAIPGTSNVPAATINSLQDQTIAEWRALRGGDLVIADDFVGPTIDASLWQSANAVTLADYLNGGFGSLDINPAGAATGYLTSVALPLGQLNWRLAARVRVVGTQSGTVVGIKSGTAAEQAYFAASAGGHWFAFAGVSGNDLGVLPSANYQLLEIYRENGRVRFLIDGVEVWSAAFATTIVTGVLTISTIATSGAAEIVADSIKLWCARYPVGAVSALPAPAHAEEGIATFDGSQDFIDVAFGTPFNDVHYKFSLTAYNSDNTDGNVGVNLRNKAQGGFRIQPDTRFAGEVSWRAWA